jgi:hypothetical protein
MRWRALLPVCGDLVLVGPVYSVPATNERAPAKAHEMGEEHQRPKLNPRLQLADFKRLSE